MKTQQQILHSRNDEIQKIFSGIMYLASKANILTITHADVIHAFIEGQIGCITPSCDHRQAQKRMTVKVNKKGIRSPTKGQRKPFYKGFILQIVDKKAYPH